MRDTLTRGLPELGVSTQHIDALEEFSRLLVAKNEVMNLTGITQPKEVATLHLLDSLSLIPLSELAGKKMIDVGTGAGFPGVPLKIALPDAEVTLLDSLNKRVEFLRESCDQLGLSGVECVHARAEEFGHREEYDYAVSRAVAALPVLCELCLPFVKVGGIFISMKSRLADEELSEALSGIGTLGGKPRQEQKLTLLGSDEELERCLIVIDKRSHTPPQFPRAYARILSKPL